MKAAEPVISIIMPVYQTGSYLEEAVRSVQAQTFPDWELLLIDDGSTDGGGALCDALAAEEARIRVFHQENRGVSSARNKGLAEARGEYFCFVDSADTLRPDFLSLLLEWQRSVPDGAACCGVAEKSAESVRPSSSPASDRLLTADQFLYEALMGLLSLPLCCANWILPKRLVSGQRFDETLRYSEDSLFLCGVLSRCGTVYYDVLPLYEYRIGREGNTAGRHTLEKSLETLRAWEAIYGLFREKDGKAPQVLLKRLTELCCEARRLALKEKKRQQAAASRKKALAYWKKMRECGEIPERDKRRLRFYIMFPLLSEKVMMKLYGRV